MTTADMPFRQGKNPSFDRIATRLAHWTPVLFLVAIPMIMLPPIGPDGFWFWASAISYVVIGATAISLAMTIQAWHIYALCPVCARKTPIDPQATIAKNRRRLRALHWLGEAHGTAYKRVQIALLVLSFVPYVMLFAWPLLLASVAVGVYLGNVHMYLQPWCPQCRWEGGGDEEKVPNPDPVGSTEKVS